MSVRYVQNITDIDDDMIMVSKREGGRPIADIRDENDAIFRNDLDRLNVLRPTVYPRATDHIPQIIESTREIIANGCGYEVDGDVFFEAARFEGYGKLNGATIAELAKRENPESKREWKKRGPLDFLLWQQTEPDEPSWDSPWGPGRPGWSIECTAMSTTHLGPQIDIHGGGRDLIFPHHENEIAQSRCAHGTDVMANVWMHNGFLQVEGQKMSKSLGNFFTINELLSTEKFGGKKWEGEALRLAMLRTHYRQPIDWTFSSLEESSNILRSFIRLLPKTDGSQLVPRPHPLVVEALSDDINTPECLQVLFRLADEAKDSESTKLSLAETMLFLGILPHRFTPEGLSEFARKFSEKMPEAIKYLEETIAEWNRFSATTLRVNDLVELEERTSPSVLNALITARLEARKAKNWAESDRIRDELAAMGIAIKDNKDGTTSWEVKR
jgi:cysteinyl-tRNA synthetase